MNVIYDVDDYVPDHYPASPTDELKRRLDRLEAHAEKQDRRFNRIRSLLYNMSWGKDNEILRKVQELINDK